MIGKTYNQKFNDYIKKIRKDIPKKYNQVRLLDYLTNSNIRLLISITTRGDGKTYNYLLALIKLALKFTDFKFLLLSRHFTLRDSYEKTLQEIVMEQFKLSRGDLYFDKNNQFTIMYIKDIPICLITELKSATDLKYSSTILKNYRLIVYDEFIALKGDYQPEEAQQLRTIFESVNRPSDCKILKTPKILLLGNPVNFDSPLFSYFNLYEILEKQKINTIERHKSVVIERWKNTESLKGLDLNVFGNDNDDDYSYSGEFITNRDLVVNAKEATHYKNQIGIRLPDEQYLVIHFDENKNYYLEITFKKPDNVKYTTILLGLKKGIQYLEDYYYDSIFEDDHNQGKIKYANTYTITQFDRMNVLKQLDYESIIDESMPVKPIIPNALDDEKEIELEQNERLKERLMKEYLFN